VGRQELKDDQALVSSVSRLHRICVQNRELSSHPDADFRNTFEIARLFLEAQNYVLTAEKPRYEPYTATPILQHILGVNGELPLGAVQYRTWVAFRQLVDHQHDFELRSLAAKRSPKKDFSVDVSRLRVRALTEVSALIPLPYRWFARRKPTTASKLGAIAKDSSGATSVARLLIFPQTTCHDEVAFLRLISMAECLFWGTLSCVRSALASFREGALHQALSFVEAGIEFASPLIKIFHAVRTIPQEHFWAFREATGDASAVQSQSWQLLDSYMYGVLPEKVAVLATIPEVRHVLVLQDSRFLPLVYVCQQLGESKIEMALRDRIVNLDQRIRAWRKYHEKQLAGQTHPEYVPKGALASGKTTGYRYLAAQQPARAARLMPHQNSGTRPATKQQSQTVNKRKRI
jgi:tryptophan 2,3-dioxygenase